MSQKVVGSVRLRRMVKELCKSTNTFATCVANFATVAITAYLSIFAQGLQDNACNFFGPDLSASFRQLSDAFTTLFFAKKQFRPAWFLGYHQHYGNEARLNAVLSMLKLSHCF